MFSGLCGSVGLGPSGVDVGRGVSFGLCGSVGLGPSGTGVRARGPATQMNINFDIYL